MKTDDLYTWLDENCRIRVTTKDLIPEGVRAESLKPERSVESTPTPFKVLLSFHATMVPGGAKYYEVHLGSYGGVTRWYPEGTVAFYGSHLDAWKENPVSFRLPHVVDHLFRQAFAAGLMDNEGNIL